MQYRQESPGSGETGANESRIHFLRKYKNDPSYRRLFRILLEMSARVYLAGKAVDYFDFRRMEDEPSGPESGFFRIKIHRRIVYYTPGDQLVARTDRRKSNEIKRCLFSAPTRRIKMAIMLIKYGMIQKRCVYLQDILVERVWVESP